MVKKDYFEKKEAEKICTYEGKCKSEGVKCSFCKHRKQKKDYWSPSVDPFFPRPMYPSSPMPEPPWRITC